MSSQRRAPRRSALSGLHPAVPAPPPAAPLGSQDATDSQRTVTTDSVSTELPEQRTDSETEPVTAGAANSQAPAATEPGSAVVRPLADTGPPEPVGTRLSEIRTDALTDSGRSRVTDVQSNEASESQSSGHKVPEPVSNAVPDSQGLEVTESGSAEIPKWRRLQRKEARLREDQISELARLRRRLSRQRNQRFEPLTDNTLIRVAVDLLLERADELSGDSEDQLRESLLGQRHASRGDAP